MIVDAFLGNNEIKLAQLRIDFLKPFVDKFFIGESTQTFSGELKELFFSEFLLSHPEYENLVRVIVIPPYLSGNLSIDRWEIEEFQRDYFLLQVQNQLQSEDIILFCDLDEIPSISQIQSCVKGLTAPVNLKMVCFYRKANWLVKGPAQEWRKPKAFKAIDARKAIRYSNFEDCLGNVGTHMSYLGMTPSEIQKKYSDFSHQELDKTHTSSKIFLEFCDEFGLNHTGWSNFEGFGLLKQTILVTEDNFQSYLLTHERDFFSTGKFRGNVLTRLIAATYVTEFLKSFDERFLKQFERKKVSFLTLIYWRSLFRVIASIVKLSLIGKLRVLAKYFINKQFRT